MLDSSPVSQCLDRKSKLLGFELFDLFVVFFSMALLNFLFSQLNHRFLMIWVPTIILAATLRLVKVGKPDNYLKHLAAFYLKPKTLCAFGLSRNNPPRKVSLPLSGVTHGQ